MMLVPGFDLKGYVPSAEATLMRLIVFPVANQHAHYPPKPPQRRLTGRERYPPTRPSVMDPPAKM